MEKKVVTITDVVKSNGDFNRSKKESNDCTVLAMAASFGISYDKANEYLQNNLNRKVGKGIRRNTLVNYFDTVDVVHIDDVTSKKVVKVETKNAYLYKRSGKVNFCQMNLNTFTKKYPKGSYYVVASNHAFVVKDGQVLDHNQFEGKMNRIVKHAWQIK